MKRILGLTPDLFFSTRISSALTRAGHAVRIVDSSDKEEIDEAVWALNPALAILDIGAAGGWPWQEVLRQVRESDPELPILAYGSHMNVEATKKAKAMGATRVVAKSEFVNNMLNLVGRYAREQQA
jgi:DNA-binding NtrC family response regulator